MLACGGVAVDGEGRAADDRGAAGSVFGNLPQRLAGTREKGRLLQQVGGRISADAEFRKHGQIRALAGGAVLELEDEADVSREVADGWIDLG
jgi:hypothetical protein